MAANPSGKASATFGLSISEKWIRERLNLQKDSLDDVRSLSLPGSYCEKITHLGRSLLGFTRLKHLDLSRNAIESLDGLEDLKYLETLNLYYNNVPSLNEVFKLGHNTKLKNLDLRLNPVTKNEPDYRLFIIHMLVNIRKLDDRSVRDSERKAAIMHFATDQANAFDDHFRQQQLQRQTMSEDRQNLYPTKHLRTDLVKSLASRPSALEEDTDYLLDLIVKSEQLSTPPSALHRHAPSLSPPSATEDSPVRYRHHYPPTTKQPQPHSHVTPTRHHTPHHTHHHHPPQPQARPKAHHGRLKAKETPKHHLSPSGGRSFSCSGGQDFSPRELDISDDSGGRHLHYADPPKPLKDFSPVALRHEESDSQLALRQMLTLIQEHVEGNLMSLEQDSGFQDQFSGWYDSHGRGVERGAAKGACLVESLQGEVEALQSELRSMEGHLREKDKGHEAKQMRIKELEDLLSIVKSESAELSRQLKTEHERMEELNRNQLSVEDSHRTLQQTKQEMSALQQKVHSLQTENQSLRDALERAPSAPMMEKAHKTIGELEADSRGLRRELQATQERHKQDLANAAQLQGVAAMLQESHRSLVVTNDHLLQELEVAKQRHSQEVTQMNLNFEQLRKTVQLYT